MPILENETTLEFLTIHQPSENFPVFIHGETLDTLKKFPDNSIDFCMTSPPYWGQRQYLEGGIGEEKDYKDYIFHLAEITDQIYRVLKDTGSFWLNIGDTYKNKKLMGIPWRVAIQMMDTQDWILRNSIIWNKIKGGPDNSKDRLRNIHENLFHFVKQTKGYFYDIDAIRDKPRKAKVVNGAIVSATGVTGVRYKRQIEMTTSLSEKEKQQALSALTKILKDIEGGKLSDFRMVIRNQQRTTHSNSKKVSGRAREIEEKGFYFLKYNPNGSKPSNVWEIIPEDTQKRKNHFAVYPEDLCKIPIKASCPKDGIVLDPFCGTGTTNYVAKILGRKSIGIDLSLEYLKTAEKRCDF